MNTRTLLSVFTFAFLGLILGYWFFAKFGGGHISVSTLFNFGGNALQSAFQSISGIEAMRDKILICGGAGAALGWLISFKLGK